ncbi:MAG: hypothetical protein KAJ51_12740 [Thermoplasmata archaeon]|nr:hypothetical protein [Thermoplasmata archaeon]
MKTKKFVIIKDVLFNSNKFSKNISKKINLDNHIVICHLFILLCTLIYGAIIGLFVGGFQIIINSIKMPIIIFGLIYISFPIFYVFDAFTDNKIDIKQVFTILLAGYSITALILVAFTPLILLFSITSVDVHFIVLLNTSIGAMAMFCGIFYIYKLFQNTHKNGQEYLSLIVGFFIIFFSGPQLLWALRPYFNYINTFTEPIKSNFYIEILKIAGAEPGLAGILALFFSTVTIFIIYNLCFSEKENINEIHKKMQTREKPMVLNEQKTDIKNLHVRKVPAALHNQYYSQPMYPPYPNPYYYHQSTNYNQTQGQKF